jgi:hypothetical protein
LPFGAISSVVSVALRPVRQVAAAAVNDWILTREVKNRNPENFRFLSKSKKADGEILQLFYCLIRQKSL